MLNLRLIRGKYKMIQWLKKRLAGTLGKHKDKIKKFPIIKQLNEKANYELDKGRNDLLRDNFEKVLSDIYNCKKESLKIWLDFGTLLGIYREKSFVSTDFDIDFGILYSQLDEFKELEIHLKKLGYTKTREFLHNGVPVEYSYSYEGLNIDFVVYREDVGYIATETIAYLQSISGKITNIETYTFKIPFKDLKIYPFKGISTLIPVNEKEYLESIYGKDFMTPILNYDWRSNNIYSKIESELSVVNLFK